METTMIDTINKADAKMVFEAVWRQIDGSPQQAYKGRELTKLVEREFFALWSAQNPITFSLPKPAKPAAAQLAS